MVVPKTPSVKTRFLIISDTHGNNSNPDPDTTLESVDVAIHCGDLTEESKIEEFRTTLQLMKNINAGLKLIIAGNHDFTMDIPVFLKKVAEVHPPLDPHLVQREYGDYGEARQLFEDAKSNGIMFLDEGNHHFPLSNGASLTVYASPFTPSPSCGWGFQYHPEQGHDFSIRNGTDIVITHGPPKGIMDFTDSRERAGCSNLFEAVARARPRLHCFGHIHEGWGAKLVAWRDKISVNPSHFTDIDNSKSVILGNIRRLNDSRSRRETLTCFSSSHCSGDINPLEPWKHTLFVNAAIQGIDDFSQMPWLIDMELPRQTTSESFTFHRQ